MGQDSGHSDESHRLLIDDELAPSNDSPVQPQYYPPVAVAHSSTQRAEEEDEPRLCRICQSGEDDDDDETAEYDEESAVEGSQHNVTIDAAGHKSTNKMLRKNPLIKPCKCKGSMMYVHLDCLNRWRKESPRATSTYACDLCGYRYHLYRPVYAKLIGNKWFINVLTALFVGLIVTLSSFAAYIVDVYVLQEAQKSMEIYFACGVIITAIIGLFIFMFRCATEGTSSINMPIWCCSNGVYPFYLADCGAIGGGDAALAGLLVILILVVATVLMFGFIGAVSGVYTLIESRVENVAGKVTERILDVE